MIIHMEDYMANIETVIPKVYSTFNQRNIDGALALMSGVSAGPRHRKAAVWAARLVPAYVT